MTLLTGPLCEADAGGGQTQCGGSSERQGRPLMLRPPRH